VDLMCDVFGVLDERGWLARAPYSLAIFQRYMAAYARHGRQASARCSSSRELSNFRACRRPRSPVGNASGSPRARIATYCAVHFPMPGISQSRVRKASESAILSKLICPLQTA
jgi:hypothetical protein